MEKQCERCNAAYEAKDRRGRFCPSCRPVASRERNATRWYVGPRTLVCQRCGGALTALRSDAKWCAECRKARNLLARVDYERSHRTPCIDCGKPSGRKADRCRVCDNRSRIGERVGPNSPTWKGGRSKHADGYWEVNIDGQRLLEHRYVWEQANGPIPDKWVVHHLNGIKDDNRLENLVAMPRSHHGPRAHIDPSVYEARIRDLEARLNELD